MPTASTTATAPHRPVVRRLARVINPVVLRVARFIPFYAVLEHRGRRSGRLHRTPLAAVRTRDGFLLPLAFGERANWVANLRHQGGANVEWRGRRFAVADPRVVAWDEGKAELSAIERRLAPVFGARSFVHVSARPQPRA